MKMLFVRVKHNNGGAFTAKHTVISNKSAFFRAATRAEIKQAYKEAALRKMNDIYEDVTPEYQEGDVILYAFVNERDAVSCAADWYTIAEVGPFKTKQYIARVYINITL